MQNSSTVCQELKDITSRLAALTTRLEQDTAVPTDTPRAEQWLESFDADMCADLFKALANNERLKILRSLGMESSYFAQLLQLTKLDNSPLRFHLTVLKDVNLISQERFRGKYAITRLGRQALVMASYFFKHMQQQEMRNDE